MLPVNQRTKTPLKSKDTLKTLNPDLNNGGGGG